MLAGAATMLTVQDPAASVAYYRDVLGFTVTFQYGEPPLYACLCRDEVAIHLRASTAWPLGNGAIAVFVNDVDTPHDELIARGAKVLKPSQDDPYGRRDFDVADLDGNQLSIGMQTQSTAAATSN